MQVVNDHVLRGVSLPFGALALAAKSVWCSTATETLWIIAWVMDNTSSMLSASIYHEVNSALSHFNIIIYIISWYFLLVISSGLSRCGSGHIPWSVTSVMMTTIITYDSYHRPWDIPNKWAVDTMSHLWTWLGSSPMTWHATLSVDVRNVRKLSISVIIYSC
jgi:hypothetical protein